ncbi:uncharacterized protein FIBRA_06791 [Fibroporia radiculosa]|uniref:Replication protein A C-terminal domain-containing protein n=1 Tax=Fibroporia radiculosa TaxID=599839 RepID=J4H496_9APHY|nr:uncharacterized protein FIBRA_06791 [Fibroporia radiculosa]CCM04609.1 predicted protein [Fibroporia radiculosa]
MLFKASQQPVVRLDVRKQYTAFEHEAIRPVTIRQLLEAQRAHDTAPFEIDGIDVDQVVVVAHLRDLRQTSTKLILRLEDGTSKGQITAHQWLSNVHQVFEESRPDQTYVRVVGRLSRFRGSQAQVGKNELRVIHLHEVTDPHEPLFHILEAFMVNRIIQVGPPPLRAPPPDAIRSPPSSRTHAAPISLLSPPSPPVSPEQAPDSPHGMSPPPDVGRLRRYFDGSPSASSEVSPGSPRHATPSRDLLPAANVNNALATRSSPEKVWVKPGHRAEASRRDPMSHLTVLQRGIILEIYNAASSKSGVDVVRIVRGISHQGVTPGEIERALDYLMDEEFIELTVDESHYRLTRKCLLDRVAYPNS